MGYEFKTGPLAKKQRGGAFKVSGYLAIFMLAVIAALGVFTHTVLKINHELQMENTLHRFSLSDVSSSKQDDYGVVHTVPEWSTVCDVFTICYTRI